MKRCKKCGEVKPVEQFYRASGTRDGFRGDCKACFAARAKARYPHVRERNIARARKWREDNPDRYKENQRRMRATPEHKRKQRARHLLNKYGITIEQYEAMLAGQGGGCAICKRPPRDDISLHVDHDHDTGAVRGLLCFRCNNALADFGEDMLVLYAAAGYLSGSDEGVAEEVELARRRASELHTTSG